MSGAELKKLIKENGVKVTKVAELLGMTRTNIYKLYEHRQLEPGIVNKIEKSPLFISTEDLREITLLRKVVRDQSQIIRDQSQVIKEQSQQIMALMDGAGLRKKPMSKK